MKLLTLILSLFFISSANITSGIDTLRLSGDSVSGNYSFRGYYKNQSINFELNNISNGNNFYYPCSTETENIDFFAFFTDYTTCSCPCINIGAAGSPRPFYKSIKTFHSLDLKQPLILSDTAIFTKIDTVLRYNCALPLTLIGRTAQDSAYIIRTNSNKFALIIIKPVDFKIFSSCDIIGKWYTYLGGYILTWFLQSDGSLDFSKVDQTGIGSNSNHNFQEPYQTSSMKNQFKIGFAKEFSSRNNFNNFYSIKGERINKTNLNKQNNIIIYN